MGGVRYFGVAEEATFGTKQTTDALFNYVDASEVNLDVPKDSMLSYAGITHRSPTVVAKGQYIPEGDIAQAIEGEFFPWMLKWAMGDYYNCLQFDGGKEAYRHTFRPGTSLKGFTARVGKEALEQVFEGCKVASLGIEIPKNDFAMGKASIVGQTDSLGTLKAESAIDTHETGFFSFCHGAVTIDSPISVDSASFEYNNNISADAGVRIGSRFPQQFDVNALEIPITLEMPFDATTHLVNFWGGASGPSTPTSKAVTIALTSDDDKIDGTNYFAYSFTFPRCYYKSVGQPVKGRDEMKQSLELTAFHDETAGYSLQATVDTGIPAYALECFFRAIFARSTTIVAAGGTRGLIHKTADGGATAWTACTSGLTAWTDRINRIEYVSDTVAYAVGMNGKVLKTSDAGATWSDVSPAGITTDWYGLFAVDATTAYICGAGGVIYYTADSGTTWAAKTSGITTDLYAITGISDKFVAVGAGGKILNSSDGTTWSVRTSGVTVDLLGVTAYEGTPDIWIAVGEMGTVLTSADAETWADKSIAGVTATLRGVDCTSATVAVVVGDSDTCYYTSNAGTAWTEKDPGTTNVSFYGVSMASASTWFIAGTFETILKSTDTGATWTAQTI